MDSHICDHHVHAPCRFRDSTTGQDYWHGKLGTELFQRASRQQQQPSLVKESLTHRELAVLREVIAICEEELKDNHAMKDLALPPPSFPLRRVSPIDDDVTRRSTPQQHNSHNETIDVICREVLRKRKATKHSVPKQDNSNHRKTMDDAAVQEVVAICDEALRKNKETKRSIPKQHNSSSSVQEVVAICDEALQKTKAIVVASALSLRLVPPTRDVTKRTTNEITNDPADVITLIQGEDFDVDKFLVPNKDGSQSAPKNKKNEDSESERQRTIMEKRRRGQQISYHNRWMEMYQRLVTFRDQHGHTRVPRDFPSDKKLGQWVSSQRLRCTDPGRIQLLDRINFEWKLVGWKNWTTMYWRLVTFQRRHGNTRVPKIYPADPKLGHWVARQRSDCKRQDRRDLLDDIGFEWSIKQPHRNCSIRSLGSLSSSSTETEETKLGRPSEEPAAPRLIGTEIVPLNPQPSQQRKASSYDSKIWHEMFDRLVDYKRKHQTARVPVKGTPLGTWVSRQRWKYRTGKLSDDRVTKLESIGFEWKVTKTTNHHRPPTSTTTELTRKRHELMAVYEGLLAAHRY